ncbi:hypothetical protein L7F22_044546 [Adiantum nelumboides]|nr:hypothetical protein [Adiantum nelumboides]
MQSDDVVWSIVGHQFCSYRLAPQGTRPIQTSAGMSTTSLGCATGNRVRWPTVATRRCANVTVSSTSMSRPQSEATARDDVGKNTAGQDYERALAQIDKELPLLGRERERERGRRPCPAGRGERGRGSDEELELIDADEDDEETQDLEAGHREFISDDEESDDEEDDQDLEDMYDLTGIQSSFPTRTANHQQAMITMKAKTQKKLPGQERSVRASHRNMIPSDPRRSLQTPARRAQRAARRVSFPAFGLLSFFLKPTPNLLLRPSNGD